MVDVIVYRLTGDQGGFTIPRWVCVECDLTVDVVTAAIEEGMAGKVRLRVKPFLRFAIEALRLHGWHPPVVVVAGKVYSQGVVPDMARLKAYLDDLIGTST